MHFLCLGRATCRRSGEKTEDEEVPLTEHEASLWTNMCSRFFYWNTMFQFQTVGVASDRCRTVLMTRQLNVFKYSWLLVSNTRLLVVSSSWRVYLLMNPFNLTNLISSVSFFLYLTMWAHLEPHQANQQTPDCLISELLLCSELRCLLHVWKKRWISSGRLSVWRKK